MERDIKTHLFDVVDNCKRIRSFVGNMDYDSYVRDELVKAAVERQFINIGESLSRIKLTDAVVFANIPDAHRIIGFRNVLVHGYAASCRM